MTAYHDIMPESLHNELAVQSGSSITSSIATSPLGSIGGLIDAHYGMLVNSMPEAAAAKAIFYVKFSTASFDSANTSRAALSQLAAERYNSLDEQLTEFENRNAEIQIVEQAAIVTTREVLRQLQKLVYAPPHMTVFGDDAFLLAWCLGETNFLMTITDGEAGYVVRQNRKTIKKKSDIKVDKYHLLRIE